MRRKKRPSYRCHFCQDLCTRVSNFVTYSRSSLHSEREVWKCTPCKSLYRFENATDPWESMEVWTRLKEDYFYFEVHRDRTFITKMVDIEDLDGFIHNACPRVVKVIESCMDITPANVNDKLKFCLLFS